MFLSILLAANQIILNLGMKSFLIVWKQQNKATAVNEESFRKQNA